MQTDAGEAFRRLPLGEVVIESLLQGGIERIGASCGKLVLLVPALAVRRAHTRVGDGKDR